MKVTVSLITASYNSVNTIGDAIRSVNCQAYEDIEHVFVDGASIDGTISIINKLSERRRIVVSEEDDGLYDALNKGVELASGDVIGFVHSDDFLANEFVVGQIADAFNHDSDLDLVYGDLDYVSLVDTSKVIRRWKSGEYKRSNFVRGWMPAHPTVFMRRSVYETLGSFDLHYSISADYDALVRYMWVGKSKANYLPEVFVKMRVGGISNRGLRNVFIKSLEDFRIMKSHGLPPYSAIFLKNLLKVPQFFQK